MCFSATASFSVAAVLLPVGCVCAVHGRSGRDRFGALGLMPVMFGIQQAAEGLVWLAVSDGALATNHTATARHSALGFMFFSHFLWLWWVPLACAFIEMPGTRRTLILVVTVIGALYGASLYLPLVLHPDWLAVQVTRSAIDYQARLVFDGYVPRTAVRALYVAIVLVPLLASSNRDVRRFGAAVAVSVVAALVWSSHAFISVWCFFAAVLSVTLCYIVVRARRRDLMALQ